MNDGTVGVSRASKRLAAALLLIDLLVSAPLPSAEFPVNSIKYWAAVAGGLFGAAVLVYITYLVARRVFQERSWAYALSAALIAHFFIAIIVRGIWLN